MVKEQSLEPNGMFGNDVRFHMARVLYEKVVGGGKQEVTHPINRYQE